MVVKKDIISALKSVGIINGDIVLVHSSLKSMGYVEGGAETIISGFLEAVGCEGTLVMPTLCQRDWENVYDTWNIDKPSDVGYITEVFRKMPGTHRSNQATHSVAALGKMAEELTKNHNQGKARYGIYGDYAFGHLSPWQKLYELKAKVVFLGVDTSKNTLRHLIEYRFVEKILEENESLKIRIRNYERLDEIKQNPEYFVWPYINYIKMEEDLNNKSLILKSKCGNADVLCISVDKMIDLTEKLLYKHPENYISNEVLNVLKF